MEEEDLLLQLEETEILLSTETEEELLQYPEAEAFVLEAEPVCNAAPAGAPAVCWMYCARLSSVPPFIWLPYIDTDHPACPRGMRCNDPPDPAQPGQKRVCNFAVWNAGLVPYSSSCI